MNLSKLKKILDSFQNQEIMVIGDVGIDIYTVGEVSRISPEAPVPIVHVKDKQFKLGLAANVSDNLIALGSIPKTIGIIGNDHPKQQLVDLFKKKKILTEGLVSDSKRQTICKERIVTSQQQIVRVDYEDLNPLSKNTIEAICKKIETATCSSKICVLQNYGKGLFNEESTKKIIQTLKKQKYKILLDPNINSELSWFKGVDLVKPNANESQSLTGIKAKTDKEFKLVCEALLKVTGAKRAIVTRGATGMSILEKGGRFRTIPTFEREVYDVSGAGDTVISVLALCEASKVDLISSVTLANLASSIEVGKRGTATVSPEEIFEEAKLHFK